MTDQCPVCSSTVSNTNDTCHECHTPIRWTYDGASEMKSTSLLQPEMLYIVYAVIAVALRMRKPWLPFLLGMAVLIGLRQGLGMGG